MGRCETALEVMKINVILTGGTIGSVYDNGFITPNSTTEYLLINNYEKVYGKNVDFCLHNPYTILSENLTGDILNKLIDTLSQEINGDSDGIIVAHGTDTLQYSACAAAYCLGSDTIPILFVSANYPLENPLSNGNINFAAAVEFIKQKAGRGVYVSYSNDLKSVDFHYPTRLLKHAEFDHRVFSLNGSYAVYKDGKIVLNKEFVAEASNSVSFKRFSDTCGILNITVSPFEEYNYSLESVKAIIFTPYHSGTLNTNSKKFKIFCQKANEKSVPMYVTGVVAGGEYQSMKAYSDLNIIPVYNMPSVPLSVKLWLEN
ncbi:MAG: hypothetical protein E7551_07065 [Ruminococcaceae bacterium]|nr:hypothetical protein [Oscillospiraceae bacterium]